MLVLRTPRIRSEEPLMPGSMGAGYEGPARHDRKERR
jgi:hypothetical protein